VKEFLLQKRQFALYCLIGVSGVTLDFGVYSLLVKTGLLGYQAANAIGYSSGTLLSFLLNARYNFRVTDRVALRMACFFSVAFVGWLASAVTLHLLVESIGWNKYVAKAATLFVVVLLQYNLNRLISFRKTNG
jgi:putative flippase GtrA